MVQLVNPRLDRPLPGEPPCGLLDDRLKDVHPDREVGSDEHADAGLAHHFSQFGFVLRPAGRSENHIDAAARQRREILRHGGGDAEIDGDVNGTEVSVARQALGVGRSEDAGDARAIGRGQRLDMLSHPAVTHKQKTHR